MTTQPETHPVLYVQFVTDGPHLHIRKWDFKPFDGGVRYDAQGPLEDAIRVAARWFEQSAINHEIASEAAGPPDNAPYVEAARRDSYRASFLRQALAAARGEV